MPNPARLVTATRNPSSRSVATISGWFLSILCLYLGMFFCAFAMRFKGVVDTNLGDVVIKSFF